MDPPPPKVSNRNNSGPLPLNMPLDCGAPYNLTPPAVPSLVMLHPDAILSTIYSGIILVGGVSRNVSLSHQGTPEVK